MELRAKQRSRVAFPLPTFAFCLLPFAFCLSPLRADIQVPPKTSSRGERQLQKRVPLPPTPVTTQVRLQPGGSVEIVLQANGALGKPIGFLLRTSPAHGVFEGAPRRVSRDSVAVTYVHRAADGPGHDAFTFATQAPGTAVSAAETVEIEVADPSPDAAAPAGTPDLGVRPSELDFGAVEDGSSSAVTLTVENRGSGLASGLLDLPLPWAVDGDASYRLGKGAQQTFRLVFRPRAEGAFAETLHVDVGDGNGTSGCVVRLVGTGLPATARQLLTLPTPAPVVMPVAVVSASPPPAPSAAPTVAGSAASPVHAAPAAAGTGTVFTNEARVTEIKVLAVGSSTVELAWKPPVPLPRSYRIERRSFARDDRAEGGVRIDWLPYERVDFRVRTDQVTATLRGFTRDEWVSMRVVSVDTAGRLAPPSPLVNVITLPGAGWWHPTLLKGLCLLLAGCLAFVIRQRWQERQQRDDLESRHLDGEPSDDSPVAEGTGSFRQS